MPENSTSLYILIFTTVCCFIEVFAEICDDGTSCTGRRHCCESGCCYDDSDDRDDRRYSYGYRLSIWNMWYFWFVVLFVLMSCFGGCGYYKQRQRVLRNQQGLGHGFLSVFQVPQRRHVSSRIVTLEPAGYASSTGFNYPQNTGVAVNLAPPPYSEVMNNPHMFPGNTKSGPPGQEDIYGDQPSTETTNQIPQPPPYSEVSNQNQISAFTANNNTSTSTNQGPA